MSAVLCQDRILAVGDIVKNQRRIVGASQLAKGFDVGVDCTGLTLASLDGAEERKGRRMKVRRMFERSEFGAPRLT
ncbi:MAG: hypothetical protein AAGH65_10230 [Pseudomonadota bacterium]